MVCLFGVAGGRGCTLMETEGSSLPSPGQGHLHNRTAGAWPRRGIWRTSPERHGFYKVLPLLSNLNNQEKAKRESEMKFVFKATPHPGSPLPRLCSLLTDSVSRGPGRAKIGEIFEVTQMTKEGSARAQEQSGPQKDSQISDQRDALGVRHRDAPTGRLVAVQGAGGVSVLRLRSRKDSPGPSRGKRSGQPRQGQGRGFGAWWCQRLTVPRLGPRSAQSRARSDGGGCPAAGLHLLDEAPALGGFAQEPPVVVGAGCGPVLLLLPAVRRPAPASETRAGASAAPPRGAHRGPPGGRRVLFPTPPTNHGLLNTSHSKQDSGQTFLPSFSQQVFKTPLSAGAERLVEPGDFGRQLSKGSEGVVQKGELRLF